jgi:hypothetical protein
MLSAKNETKSDFMETGISKYVNYCKNWSLSIKGTIEQITSK